MPLAGQRLRHLTLVLLALVVSWPAVAGPRSAGPPPVCAADENVEPFGGACAKVRDHRVSEDVGATQALQTLPDLASLRATAARAGEASQRRDVTIPPPGGIGGGTTYIDGKLRALRQGELYTRMIVQPNGLRETTSGLDWLFTTSTNRVERGVEVVALYPRWEPEGGSLGIFDWSCTPADPCPGGATEPSWIWDSALAADGLRCNIEQTAAAGHVHRILYYANVSRKRDQAATPLWVNRVLLWNNCDDAWDLVYEHRYRARQLDCSVGSACGWWGPIFETFESDPGQPYPMIRELGFLRSRLLHDGAWSELGPSETEFSPPSAPWRLFHATPNRSYAAGNFVTRAVDFSVRTGSTSRCLAPGGYAEVKAAILSAKDFQPLNIDPASIKIGRNGAAPIRYRLTDLNGDRTPDFVIFFRPKRTGLVAGDTTLPVLARMRAGRDIGGVAIVRTVGCG